MHFSLFPVTSTCSDTVQTMYRESVSIKSLELRANFMKSPLSCRCIFTTQHRPAFTLKTSDWPKGGKSNDARY